MVSYTLVLPNDLPNNSDKIKRTIKTKNRILAIEAAPAAMPPKPNMAAMMATIAKMTVQRSIIIIFRLN